MSDLSRQPELTPVQREALAWYWKLKDSELSLEDWHRWLKWHSVPAHRQAFEFMASVWESLCRHLARTDTSAAASSPLPPPQLHHRNNLLWTATSGAIAVLIFLLVTLNSGATVLKTDNRTWRAEVLEDGSLVRLAPGTRLKIDLSPQGRLADLTRGKAFFSVAKDRHRPFIVRTNGVIVKALGTRFGVSQQDDESIVTVMEGTVAVSRSQKESARAESIAVKLNASQQFRVSRAGSPVVSQVNSLKELGWATTIQFAGPVLIDKAVEEFNRLSGVQLELPKPKPDSQMDKYSAFPLDEPELFAQYIADRIAAPVIVHGPGATVRTIYPETT